MKEVYKNHYKVHFFVTEDWAIIRDESNIWHYHEHEVAHAQKGMLKLRTKHDRLNMFKKALKKIKYEHQKKTKAVKETSLIRNQAIVLNPVYAKWKEDKTVNFFCLPVKVIMLGEKETL